MRLSRSVVLCVRYCLPVDGSYIVASRVALAALGLALVLAIAPGGSRYIGARRDFSRFMTPPGSSGEAAL